LQKQAELKQQQQHQQHQLGQEIQIYEQAEPPQTSNEPLSTTAEQVTEVKSHYTNLEPVVHSIN
jgi:hypothetical protein